jgi:TPP-dependent 2-oxoacid decarboxylase
MTVGEFCSGASGRPAPGTAFGVPGDYNLELLQQMEDSGTLTSIGACNELDASYAADGYARLNGMAALIVTNAVGALSAINGVAGSYAEHVPVICVCGSIPYKSMERGLGMHHTMADGTWDRFITAYAQVTTAQERITPDNAVTEIDRLIRAAWHEKLPVWQAVQSYIRSGDVLIADDGTSYASAGLQLPPNCSFVSQVIWGSIGYSVGSLLGTLTAAPDRRHLLFVGDGSTTSRTGPTPICRKCSGPTPRRDHSSSRPWPTWRRPSARRTTAWYSSRQSWIPSTLRPRSSTAATTEPTSTTALAARSTAATC